MYFQVLSIVGSTDSELPHALRNWALMAMLLNLARKDGKALGTVDLENILEVLSCWCNTFTWANPVQRGSQECPPTWSRGAGGKKTCPVYCWTWRPGGPHLMSPTCGIGPKSFFRWGNLPANHLHLECTQMTRESEAFLKRNTLDRDEFKTRPRYSKQTLCSNNSFF